jgi:mannose-1-phosphate guanylyltransferase
MPNKLHAIVLAGGSGTRFWPESRESLPKQYLTLFGHESLLRYTLKRFEGLVDAKRRFVVTIQKQIDLALENSLDLIGSKDHIILEPNARNTLPCILLSLAHLEAQGISDSDAVVIVPSDHIILNQDGFRKTVKDAMLLCMARDELITIGITPNFPHTGFGYIEKGAMVDAEAFQVKKFKEKPPFELAAEYVSSGRFLWNAGMFVGKIKVFKEEIQKYAPTHYAQYQALVEALRSKNHLLIDEIYGRLPSDSIDYRIMEHSKKVLVVPAQFDWNDLGSWDALESILDETDNNTVARDQGHFFYNATDNIVYAPKHFVSLLHLKDLIVVVNDESIMILPKEKSQDVKKVTEYLKNHRPDLL